MCKNKSKSVDNIISPMILWTKLLDLSFFEFDPLEDVFDDVDFDNEKEVKKVLRYVMYIPFCYNNSKRYQRIFKNTLQYYLSTDDIDYVDFFLSTSPSFELPKNPRDFFVWLWEVFFGEENYQLSDSELAHILKIEDNVVLGSYFENREVV